MKPSKKLGGKANKLGYLRRHEIRTGIAAEARRMNDREEG